MKYNPQYHHRRSIRLPHYDYSQSGFYFVTICTYQKQCLFGDLVDGKMLLNQIGKMVREEWLKSSQIRQEIELDEWVIMPNHLHGIVVIQNNNSINKKGADHEGVDYQGADYQGADYQGADYQGADYQGASLAPLRRKPRSLASFVGGFKSSVTRRIKVFCIQPNPRIWQRNYYESVIRNEQHLNQIRQYIIDNPHKWAEDTEKPKNDFQELLIDFVF